MKWVLTSSNHFTIQAILMRVLSCKFHCPSLDCFSKPSLGLYSPSALKLEVDDDAQHPSSSLPLLPNVLEEKSLEEEVEVEVDKGVSVNVDVKVDRFLKSSLKRPVESGTKGAGKGRVKWMDFLGKELVEIREFEVSDSGDSDDDADGDGIQGCICVIQ